MAWVSWDNAASFVLPAFAEEVVAPVRAPALQSVCSSVAPGRRAAALAAAPGASFVFFSPSALEADRERAYLEKRGAAVFGVKRNPFHAPQWRQSGQAANDVYRKHRYAVGGVLPPA